MRIGLVCCALGIASAAAAGAAESPALQPIVVRSVDGAFLAIAPGGPPRTDRRLPPEQDLPQLLTLGQGLFALKTSDGRFFSAGPAGLQLASQIQPQPVASQRIRLARAEGNRTVLSGEGNSGGPVVELHLLSEIPSALRSALGLAIQAVLVAETKDREYQKQRTRQRQRWVDIPAPTLNNIKRTKPLRILSVTDEYDIKARLDGTPRIDILRLAQLKPYRPSAASLLWLEVRAQLPLAGQVHYEIPNKLSSTTGYRAVLGLAVAGHLGLDKSGDQLKIQSPNLLQFQAAIDRLDISNDLLNALREPIEDAINHELRQNEPRIREKTNQSIAKGLQARELNHPLLRLLVWP
jgi:hypothetical protein